MWSPSPTLPCPIRLSSSVEPNCIFTTPTPTPPLPLPLPYHNTPPLYCLYPYPNWNWAVTTQGWNDPGPKRLAYLGRNDPPQKLAETTQAETTQAETTQGRNDPDLYKWQVRLKWLVLCRHLFTVLIKILKSKSYIKTVSVFITTHLYN